MSILPRHLQLFNVQWNLKWKSIRLLLFMSTMLSQTLMSYALNSLSKRKLCCCEQKRQKLLLNSKNEEKVVTS